MFLRVITHLMFLSVIPYSGFFMRSCIFVNYLAGLYFSTVDLAQKYVPIKNSLQIAI